MRALSSIGCAKTSDHHLPSNRLRIVLEIYFNLIFFFLVYRALNRLRCSPSHSPLNFRGLCHDFCPAISQSTSPLTRKTASPICALTILRRTRSGTCSRCSALLAERLTTTMSGLTASWVCLFLFACVPGSSQFLNQELNEMSGSRGEANFVWRCKNCKVGSHNLSRD